MENDGFFFFFYFSVMDNGLGHVTLNGSSRLFFYIISCPIPIKTWLSAIETLNLSKSVQ